MDNVRACQVVDQILSGAITLSPPLSAERKKQLIAIRQASTAKFDKIYWDTVVSATRIAACKSPSTSNDCAPIERYTAEYPNGMHVAEAKALLASSATKRAQLRKAEVAARAQDDAETERAGAKRLAIAKQCYQSCMPQCAATGENNASCDSRCQTGCNYHPWMDK
jgi:hypothetical protein